MSPASRSPLVPNTCGVLSQLFQSDLDRFGPDLKGLVAELAHDIPPPRHCRRFRPTPEHDCAATYRDYVLSEFTLKALPLTVARP